MPPHPVKPPTPSEERAAKRARINPTPNVGSAGKSLITTVYAADVTGTAIWLVERAKVVRQRTGVDMTTAIAAVAASIALHSHRPIRLVPDGFPVE